MKDLVQIKKAYIVGAHSRGQTLKNYLASIYPAIDIVAFLVDDTSCNPAYVEGIPVCGLDDVCELDKRAAVFIATKGIYHASIEKQLEEHGMRDVIPVTVEVDNYLRNTYIRKEYQGKGRPFIKLEEISANIAQDAQTTAEGTIYMAQSVYDKPVTGRIPNVNYITPIQVGAALTDRRLYKNILTDSCGKNISEKNRQYSELTAMYWMWKNAGEEFLGLCHYRRHFILPDNWAALMKNMKIDAVLPVPSYAAPNIEENYKARHEGDDWVFLMQYLKTEYPEDYRIAVEVFSGQLYSPCNMFITRKNILDELCEWLFPILSVVEEHVGEKEDVYQNRYLGFISERLITLFFEKKKNLYYIVYADKIFLN